MTEDEHHQRIIPARVTVADLATALGLPIEDVQAVLDARQEPFQPGDLVAGEVSIQVGSDLDRPVSIEARDLALETLYQIEVGGNQPNLAKMGGRSGVLVRGVLEKREELDHEIERAAEHWSVARMPVLDRTILRIGLYELRYSPDTPTAVAVSEAVRLATTYSTERSGSFVNGVLASLARGR
jgi:transcription antitermination protein NusB